MASDHPDPRYKIALPPHRSIDIVFISLSMDEEEVNACRLNDVFEIVITGSGKVVNTTARTVYCGASVPSHG